MIIYKSMKFYESHFEDYCKSYVVREPNETIDMSNNMIIYGSTGVGKYSYMLNLLRPLSPSQLKYDKKVKASTDKQSYIYRISDIHYEIDMSLLGCNSKLIWHEIYCQIIDIITIKPDKLGYIVCKNFHAIHNELLEIFYSYMQKHCYGYDGRSREIQVYFIIITEHISFFPNNILNRCQKIGIGRPSKETMITYAKTNKTKPIEHLLCDIETSNVVNLKELYSFSLIDTVEKIPGDYFNKICDIIIDEMIKMHKRDYDHTNITYFRDCLYDVLIYNLDGIECIWTIYKYFVENGYITDQAKNMKLLKKMATILKQYGNNYRSIFHIEHAIFSILDSMDV
jgi:hypothetical protein